jgi:hypothetical protein
VWVNKLATTCQCCAQGKDARRSADRRRCCAVASCCQEYPSARTVRDVRDTVRAALASVIGEELVSRNVAMRVKPPERRRQRRAWSSDEPAGSWSRRGLTRIRCTPPTSSFW